MADRITRRPLLRILGGSSLLSFLAGCGSSDDDDSTGGGFTEGFEADLDAWKRDADVPDDPNDPGEPVEWMIEQSMERAAGGNVSLRYVLDGRQDDGTIWVTRPVEIESGRAYDVRMTAQAWSASESFNTLAHLVMYAGPTKPTVEESFPAPGENSSDAGVAETGGLREPLNQREGWLEYSFAWTTPTLDTDTIHVAVGISAVWETEMTYFVDDVAVSVTPR